MWKLNDVVKIEYRSDYCYLIGFDDMTLRSKRFRC